MKFATASKRRRISALLEAYRGCVNRFIKKLWYLPEGGFGLDKKTLALVSAGRLTERFKSNALKQAIEIVGSTRLSGTVEPDSPPPHFKGAAILDSKFVSIEDKKRSLGDPFDLAIRLSSLSRGNKIVIPTCRTRPLNKWMNKPSARLVQGFSAVCGLVDQLIS